jgi:predicted PurR-regulated permease PerM
MIVIAGLRAFSSSIGPIFLALIIVVVVSPVHGMLIRRGAPNWVATAALLVVSLSVLIAIVVALVWSAAGLVNVLGSEEYVDQFGDAQQSLVDLADRWEISTDDVLSELDFGTVASQIAGQISTAVSSVIGLTSAATLLTITMLFLAVDTGRFEVHLERVSRQQPEIARGLRQFARRTRAYFIVTTVFGLIVATFNVITLMVLGIPLPFVWGILSLVSNYIPNVGLVIGMVPPALLALFEGGWELAVWVIVLYLLANTVIQTFIQPKFVGDAVGLSTTLTFLSLIFWSWVLGPLGALLAVPMTLLAKALLIDIDPGLRWIDPLVALPSVDRDREDPILADLLDIEPHELAGGGDAGAGSGPEPKTLESGDPDGVDQPTER